MKIERNCPYELSELNSLLESVNWDEVPTNKFDKMHSLTWSWITARDETGRLIGFVRVLSDGFRHAYILGMIVHPDFQDQGIGTAIMTELMEMLGEQQLMPTLVAVPGKEHFYQQFGFEVESNRFTAMCIRKPYWESRHE